MFAIFDMGGSQSPYVAGVFRDRKVSQVSGVSGIQPVGRESRSLKPQAHEGSLSFQQRLYEQVQAFSQSTSSKLVELGILWHHLS